MSRNDPLRHCMDVIDDVMAEMVSLLFYVTEVLTRDVAEGLYCEVYCKSCLYSPA